MSRQRAPKKSETVEIRLSHPVKTAFMDRCRAEGRTASDAIRQFIEMSAEASTHETWPPDYRPTEGNDTLNPQMPRSE